MKDSGIEWIREIPEHWERTKLLNLLRQPICDGPHETPNLLEDGIPFISVDSLNNTENVDLSKCKKFISVQDYERYMEKANLEKNDVLFTKAATIGKTAIVGDEVFMVWSPIAIIKTNEFIAHYKYVYHTLNCYELIKHISLLGSFNTQINVGMRELEKAIVPLPPLSEQKAIADFLDKQCAEIDSVIEQTKATIEEYKKLKQSVITESVTKGIRGDRPMKDSGIEWIGEIPAEWTRYKIKHIADLFGRIGFRGYTTDDLVDEGEGAITLSPSNLKEMRMDYSKCSYITWEKYEESPEIQIHEGDILMVKTGSSYGKSSYVNQLPLEATINPQLIAIKNIKILAKYLIYCMQTPYFLDQTENAVVGGTIPTISQEKINNFFIVSPNQVEQEEIVAYLDQKCAEIDTLIENKTALLEEMESLKKSIIFEYVTGKKKVLN